MGTSCCEQGSAFSQTRMDLSGMCGPDKPAAPFHPLCVLGAQCSPCWLLKGHSWGEQRTRSKGGPQERVSGAYSHSEPPSLRPTFHSSYTVPESDFSIASQLAVLRAEKGGFCFSVPTRTLKACALSFAPTLLFSFPF